QLPRLQDEFVECGQELTFGDRVHVQGMDHPVAGEVVEKRPFERRVVVAIVKRAGTGEEVQVGTAILVVQPAASCVVEYLRPGPAVAAHSRFTLLEDCRRRIPIPGVWPLPGGCGALLALLLHRYPFSHAATPLTPSDEMRRRRSNSARRHLAQVAPGR